MDPLRFESSDFGRVIEVPDGHIRWFDPAPLPLHLELSDATSLALSQADDALGRLAGVGRLLRNKETLIRLYFMKESLASSRIEGTQAEITDAFEADARPPRDRRMPELGTVLRLVRSLEYGFDVVAETRSVTIDLAIDVHRYLFEGSDFAGQMRDELVWLGSPTDRPETADFVPPAPDRLSDALREWEQFSLAQTTMPPLVRAAMLHYQFLTIHPFRDGNGRVARILALLFLAAQDRLPEPLLYLSPYLESRRRDYYDRLQAVRERGSIQEWLQFFLTAVEHQARDGVDRAERLLDLRDRYHQELVGSRSRAIEVVDLLFEHAVVSAALVRDELEVSHQGALNLIRGLEKRGWLSKLPTTGRGGAQYWLAVDVIDVVEGDAPPTSVDDDRPRQPLLRTQR